MSKTYQVMLGEVQVGTRFRLPYGPDYWLVEDHSMMGTACLCLRTRKVRVYSCRRMVTIDVPQ